MTCGIPKYLNAVVPSKVAERKDVYVEWSALNINSWYSDKGAPPPLFSFMATFQILIQSSLFFGIQFYHHLSAINYHIVISIYRLVRLLYRHVGYLGRFVRKCTPCLRTYYHIKTCKCNSATCRHCIWKCDIILSFLK